MKRAARIDANQNEIVSQLRQLGYEVLIISQLKNCFDILVGANGKNYAFEIKDGTRPPSQRKLTPGEIKFHNEWKGQINIVFDIHDCLNVINGKI